MPPATWQLLMSTGWSTTGGTGAEGGVHTMKPFKGIYDDVGERFKVVQQVAIQF